MSRRKRWVLIGLMLLLIAVGPYLYSRLTASSRVVRVVGPEGSGRISPEVKDSFSVLIYNIAHGRGPVTSNLEEGGAEKRERIAEIGEFLKQIDADIVILNEVDFCSTWSGHQNQAEAIAQAAGYEFRGELRNYDWNFIYGSWKFGNAVLSRFPITEAEEIDLPSQQWWEPWLAGKKRAAKFRIHLAESKSIDVIPIHLEVRSEETRSRSVARLLSVVKASKVPVVLGGDFNSTPTGMPDSSKAPELGNAIDKLDQSGLFVREAVTAEKANFTYSSSKPKSTIDWIIPTKPNTILEYRVIDSTLSDHRPVFARIGLGSGE